LETREVIVNLIANTRTSKGLTIQADLNVNSYSKGIKVSDEENDAVEHHADGLSWRVEPFPVTQIQKRMRNLFVGDYFRRAP
jgi:hypothetical protein